MASIFEQLRGKAGEAVGSLGKRLNLPEFGISERISGTPLIASGGAPSGGGGETMGGGTGTISGYATPAYDYGTSSSSGGSSTNVYQDTTNAPTEQAVEDPFAGYDIDAMMSGAYEAFNQAEQAAQSSYQAGLSKAESDTAQQKAGLQSEQESKMAEFGQQRERETSRKEGVVNQARRLASELMQGNQARFGGTTGTGKFFSELIGREAVANIGQNNQLWQEALGKINQAENSLKTKVTEMSNAADEWLKNTKLQLRANLDKTLADIGAQRGATASDIAQTKLNALLNYQSYLQDLNARNTAYKQQLFDSFQTQQQRLATMANTANERITFNTLPPELTNFNVGDTAYKAVPTNTGGFDYVTGQISNKDEEGVNPFE